MVININKDLRFDKAINHEDKITETLSKYTEKIRNEDNTVSYNVVGTDYFLINDEWHLKFFKELGQFKEQLKEYKYSGKKISFPFKNTNLTKEMKFIVYSNLFSDKWTLRTTFKDNAYFIVRLAQFLNEKHPNLISISELNLEKAKIQWIDWLNANHIKTSFIQVNLDKKYRSKKPIVNFLETIVTSIRELTDERDEWKKDRWDIRRLEQYGITYNKSRADYFVDFGKIRNLKIREDIKEYIKQRLISGNRFSWSSAMTYLNFLPNFINFIYKIEPKWDSLNSLERKHMEKYIEWLNVYAKGYSNPKKYIARTLKGVQAFLSDIQRREYAFAPVKSSKTLLYPEDIPNIQKKLVDQIDYIPDFVLEQLFENINSLNKEFTPVIYIMLKTGLRISDVLGLKQDCLVRLNSEFWLEADIKKTYVEGHRIPIDNELAEIMSILIDKAKNHSNKNNNPEKYVFVRYSGSRKGKPYYSRSIQNSINLLAEEFNIVDELGNRYHFKNHAFRHTFAVKMLNGGADILTVQELLAHASPEMTMRYAKLLDDTKRKVFNNAVKQGIFSFSEGDRLKEENGGEIPSDILDMLYTNHKLNAIDTPYGTCLQRTNGKCGFAKQPPCLTCNGGHPCKDLCVGAFEGDIQKYEILINSTKSMIENAKMYNRSEMAKENEELLQLYEDIHDKISQGNMIYSRLDKLKRKDDKNE